MKSAKQEIRRRLRAERNALESAFVSGAGEALRLQVAALAAYAAANAVLAYVASDNEAPTAHVIGDALDRGKEVFLPRIGEEDFVSHRPHEPMAAGRWGIPEPAAGRRFVPESGRAVVLVPLVGWTLAGERLGRGAGWYDRVLRRLGERTVTVGLGYEFQRCDSLPQEPGDFVLDYIATERRLVQCRAEGDTRRIQEGGEA